MRLIPFSILLSVSSAMVGCGSAAEEPIEQIIVSEPGQSASAKRIEAPAGDLVSKGKAAFAACSACHSVKAGAPAGPGPNLRGIFGRKAGSAEGFAYSDAMKASGITWSEAELDSFIANPTGKVSGTSMVAGAISDPGTRRAIIAYLASNIE